MELQHTKIVAFMAEKVGSTIVREEKGRLKHRLINMDIFSYTTAIIGECKGMK